MDFPGVALVTGAASGTCPNLIYRTDCIDWIHIGIGRAAAILYAKEGCKRITIADLNPSGLEETKTIIESCHKDVTIRTAICDVTSEDAVQSLVHHTVKHFGRLDYCANVAGIVLLGPTTAEMSTAFFDKHYQVNLRGLFFCVRAEIQAMLKQEPLLSK